MSDPKAVDLDGLRKLAAETDAHKSVQIWSRELRWLLAHIDALTAEPSRVEDSEVAEVINALLQPGEYGSEPPSFDVKVANLLSRIAAAKASAERESVLRLEALEAMRFQYLSANEAFLRACGKLQTAEVAAETAEAKLREARLKFASRAEEQRQWLNDNAPYVSHDQKHLDADTEARAYWHYGYAIALSDVLRALSNPE